MIINKALAHFGKQILNITYTLYMTINTLIKRELWF